LEAVTPLIKLTNSKKYQPEKLRGRAGDRVESLTFLEERPCANREPRRGKEARQQEGKPHISNIEKRGNEGDSKGSLAAYGGTAQGDGKSESMMVKRSGERLFVK